MTEEDDNEPDVDLSEGMEFSAQRDGMFAMPFTPVLDCEREFVLQMIAEYSKHQTTMTRSANQYTICDYEAVVVAWNHDCNAELEKPLEERSETGEPYKTLSQGS